MKHIEYVLLTAFTGAVGVACGGLLWPALSAAFEASSDMRVISKKTMRSRAFKCVADVCS